MSTTAIVALLQSALLLLAMAQSTLNLPQGFKTNAVSVAEQAIADATTALSASSTKSTTFTASTTNQTFTTPSGAVIGIGADGNVFGIPASAEPAATTDAPALSVSMVPEGLSSASLSQDLPWLDEEIWRGELSFPASIQLTASTSEDVYITSLPAILSVSNGAKITDIYDCYIGGGAIDRLNPSQSGAVEIFQLNGGMEVPRGHSVGVGVSCYIGVPEINSLSFLPPQIVGETYTVVGGTYTLSLDPNVGDYDVVGNTSNKPALITLENNASSSITVQPRT